MRMQIVSRMQRRKLCSLSTEYMYSAEKQASRHSMPRGQNLFEWQPSPPPPPTPPTCNTKLNYFPFHPLMYYLHNRAEYTRSTCAKAMSILLEI